MEKAQLWRPNGESVVKQQANKSMLAAIRMLAEWNDSEEDDCQSAGAVPEPASDMIWEGSPAARLRGKDVISVEVYKEMMIALFNLPPDLGNPSETEN